jgi:outer membrane receptor protein involved in Fe transport
MYEWNEATSDWQLSIPLSNDLRHREYIPAAYVMYSSKLSQQLTMKIGLRFEYSRTTLKNDKAAIEREQSQASLSSAEREQARPKVKDHLDEASNCYFVAPNLVLNYRISAPWQLSVGLSRRISRPTYPQLNPYINLIDNNTYETGNVHLKPEKANKLDIGYSYAGTSRQTIPFIPLSTTARTAVASSGLVSAGISIPTSPSVARREGPRDPVSLGEGTNRRKIEV